MAIAWSYIRFSSIKQKKGDSFNRQQDLYKLFVSDQSLAAGDIPFLDEGISGFGKKKRKGMQDFIGCIQDGTVKAGDFLVVENIDRLTREPMEQALNLITTILGAGVKIAILSPNKYVLDNASINSDLIWMIIGELKRAHAESLRKSGMAKAKWERRRNEDLPAHKIISPKWPFWLKKVGNTWEPIPKLVALVQRIFRDRLDGINPQTICRLLNKEGVKNPRGAFWTRSGIQTLICNRAVFGEYTCCEYVNGKRTPVKVIPGYYPVIVPEADYYGIQGLRQQYSFNKGRDGKEVSNLFTGLLYDPSDKLAYRIHWSKTTKKLNKTLVNSGAMDRGKKQGQVPYDLVEFLILDYLADLDLESIFSPKREEEKDTDADDLKTLDGKIRELQKALAENPDVTELLQPLTVLSRQRKEIAGRIEAKKKSAIATDAPKDFGSLVREMYRRSGDDLTTVRHRIRNKLQIMLDRVWLGITKQEKSWKFLEFTAVFRNGETRQLFVIYHYKRGAEILASGYNVEMSIGLAD